MLEILFAGTGASVPSRDRSLPCIAVRTGRSVSLFDCGEGAQRQLMLSKFSFMKTDRIFITHMHGDHILGLPGLLQTMGMSGRREKVEVFGPEGIRGSLCGMMDACEGDLEFELVIHEVNPGDRFEFDRFSVTVFATAHGCASVGYRMAESDRPGVFDREKAVSLGLDTSDFSRIQKGETVKGVDPKLIMGPTRPGLSLVYTGDTMSCDSVAEAVRGADVLIHEGTYMDDDRSLAEDHFHSTIGDVARMAKDSDVRNLFLVHISNRYGDDPGPLEEAKAIFADVIMPNDLDAFTVTPDGIRSL